MTTIQLDTPCVGICSTVYGDNVCRGCKRFWPEIVEWNTFDKIKKQQIFDRLGNHIHSVVETKVIVVDAVLLRNQLTLLGIRYRADQSAYCDIYYLLRAGARQIKHSNDFGFELHAAYRDLTLVELFTLIEQEYLALAQHVFTQQQSHPQVTTSLKPL